MKKKACAILVGTVLICQTASVYGAVQDYQAVTKADKEDNKTIQTFQTEDGDGNAVTVAAVQDTLYVTQRSWLTSHWEMNSSAVLSATMDGAKFPVRWTKIR